MCSMNGGQLGRICRAIDELAADSASADRGAGESAPAASEDGMAHGGAAHQDGAADQDRPADRAGPADLGRDGTPLTSPGWPRSGKWSPTPIPNSRNACPATYPQPNDRVRAMPAPAGRTREDACTADRTREDACTRRPAP